MTQITKHFSDYEFRCQCGCGSFKIDHSFVHLLENLRGMYGKPMAISSGYRCNLHNTAVGGSPRSMHLEGRAADIYIPNGAEMRLFIESVFAANVFGGIGIGRSFVHLDNRKPNRICWGY